MASVVEYPLVNLLFTFLINTHSQFAHELFSIYDFKTEINRNLKYLQLLVAFYCSGIGTV